MGGLKRAVAAVAVVVGGLAGVGMAAKPAAAGTCSLPLDCTSPVSCSSGATTPRMSDVWYEGGFNFRIEQRYSPSCRTIWSRLRYLQNPRYQRYYPWTNRQSGPGGDTFGYQATYDGANRWMYSAQLDDQGFVGTAWGGFSVTTDIFNFPSVGAMQAYGNTYPPY